MALVLFGIGIMVIMRTVCVGIASSADLDDMQRAISIAQTTMAELKSVPFVDLGDRGAAPDAYFPRFSTAIDVTEGANPMTVSVIVSWLSNGEIAETRVTTMVADYAA